LIFYFFIILFNSVSYFAVNHHHVFYRKKMFGKVSMLNGDGSIITTGTIVPVRQTTTIILQIKSNDDGVKYDQADWIAKYDGQVQRESIYASNPEASRAYAENFKKAIDAAHSLLAFAPPTPRPVRRTIMRSPECEWY
jgi:hypothetical protein